MRHWTCTLRSKLMCVAIANISTDDDSTSNQGGSSVSTPERDRAARRQKPQGQEIPPCVPGNIDQLPLLQPRPLPTLPPPQLPPKPGSVLQTRPLPPKPTERYGTLSLNASLNLVKTGESEYCPENCGSRNLVSMIESGSTGLFRYTL
ncbi:hypothetical protein QYM36_004666 [Artemia franciscana]|uniref:Uncharacterized protein n=1 Tax=Artemia franciscana TaxID=6661 RepID=A0AA88I3G6_ARTSF|nr:hypothetical protein QYM36_004666 [Artemia franciscana]